MCNCTVLFQARFLSNHRLSGQETKKKPTKKISPDQESPVCCGQKNLVILFVFRRVVVFMARKAGASCSSSNWFENLQDNDKRAKGKRRSTTGSLQIQLFWEMRIIFRDPVLFQQKAKLRMGGTAAWNVRFLPELSSWFHNSAGTINSS